MSRDAFVKRRNAVKLQKVIFLKSQKNCLLRTSTKGRLFRTFNSYSFIFNMFNGGLCNHRIGFCQWQTRSPGWRAVAVIYENWPRAISLHFLLFDSSKRLFLDVLSKYSIIRAQLCVILMPWALVSVALKKW